MANGTLNILGLYNWTTDHDEPSIFRDLVINFTTSSSLNFGLPNILKISPFAPSAPSRIYTYDSMVLATELSAHLAKSP